MQPVVTTSDLAEELGVQPATVARWINSGRFPGAFQVRGRWRIPLDAVQRFLDDLEDDEDRGGGSTKLDESQEATG